MKHIRMPKAIAEAWLKDLRTSPKQGFHSLEDVVTGGHCCLGRLQVVVDGGVERHEDGSIQGLPSFGWLSKNKIEFLDQYGSTFKVPYCAEKGLSFSGVNDECETPLPIIADLLEAEIEYND